MTYVDYPIRSDLERLQYDEIREMPSLFGQTWLPFMCATMGYLVPVGLNVGQNKPLRTGIWRYPLGIAAGALLGIYLRDRKAEKSRERYAIVKHYIELHPEDFPPYPPRVKVGQTLSAWIPRRPGW